jgi:stage III sporulation protein AA
MQNIQIAYKQSSLPSVLRESLPKYFSDAILRTGANPIEEIRMHRGRILTVTSKQKNLRCGIVVSEKDIQETFSRMCGGSLYAYEETIRAGYIPLEGGIRVGVCGSAACEDGKIIGVHNITGLMIRIPHAIALETSTLLNVFFAGSVQHGLLIYSPPGVGKTTLLRAVAKEISSPHYGRHTVIVDTRGELNVELNDPTLNLDIMSGYPRDVGIEIADRTLGAQIIICDEIGSIADAHATLNAANCGVPLIASAHAASVDELLERPAIEILHRAHVFGKYVGLSRRTIGGFDYHITDWRDLSDKGATRC